MNTLKKFISRKFLIAILTPILIGINAGLDHPLEPDAVRNIIAVVVAYLIGQSAVDVLDKKRRS